MTTTWLSVRDQPMFAWAGLWRDSEEWGPVFTGVMTSSAAELMEIHDRSPVILEPHQWDDWLEADIVDDRRFGALDRPFPADRLVVNRTNTPWKDGRIVPN